MFPQEKVNVLPFLEVPKNNSLVFLKEKVYCAERGMNFYIVLPVSSHRSQQIFVRRQNRTPSSRVDYRVESEDPARGMRETWISNFHDDSFQIS